MKRLTENDILYEAQKYASSGYYYYQNQEDIIRSFIEGAKWANKILNKEISTLQREIAELVKIKEEYEEKKKKHTTCWLDHNENPLSWIGNQTLLNEIEIKKR